CVTPSDWQAQSRHKANNPVTVNDWKAALDGIVRKQGTFTMVFHPHGWIRSGQIIDLIDYAVAKHGKKVKFLTFREALERLNKNLLAGEQLREPRTAGDNGVRLGAIHGYDEYVSVITDNKSVREARVWIEKDRGGCWKKRGVAAGRPRWAPKGYSVYRPIAIGPAPEHVTEYVVANDKDQAVFVWNGGPFDLDKADFNLPPGAKLGRGGVDY